MEEPTTDPWLTLLSDPLWIIAGAAAIGLLLLILIAVIVWRIFRRREEIILPPPVDLAIDVAELSQDGPASSGLRAEVYGTPVRIAAIVLAPVGRDGVVPQMDEFLDIIPYLIPNFADVVTRDQPLIRAWSGQLSSQGFANAFFNSVPLPGDRGKGTPWCSLVGKFTANKQQYLAGVVCRGTSDNALSQYTIQHEAQWNDILRVRRP